MSESKSRIVKGVVLFILITVLVIGSFFCLFRMLYPLKYKREICSFSEKYNVDKVLIFSIINTESGFVYSKTSSKGAVGLMQIMPSTAIFIADNLQMQSFEVSSLYQPHVNIEFGIYYISYLFNKFENIDNVICAYNAGETVVRSWLNDKNYSTDGKTLNLIPYQETKNYLEKVKNNYKIYEKLV